MPGKSKKIQGARRGILKLTTAEKRLHETFGEDAAWTNENYDPKTIAARLETTVRVTIRGLEKQLGLLKLADPALLARAVEVFESEECAATWLVTVQPFSKDKTPLQLALSRRGRQEVLNALGRIENGVFS